MDVSATIHGMPALRKTIFAAIVFLVWLPFLGPDCGHAFVLPFPTPSASPGSNAVPQKYRALYTSLQNAISQANGALDSAATGQTNTPIFGAALLAADGNIGPSLLAPSGIVGVRVYLDGLQTLGVQGVMIQVTYPLLVSSFTGHDRYLSFYEQVAHEVRSRGMKLDIETTPVFPQQGVLVNYAGLTPTRYSAQKNQMAQTIIANLQPDYLDIGAEPDTEAGLLRLPQLNSPQGWAAHVTRVLSGLSHGSTKVVAGIGSWENVTLAQGLTGTSLDALTIHFYPIGAQSMNTALQVATLAHRSGKAVILDEAWLYKSTQPLPATRIDAYYNNLKRDVFSFWAPLDQENLAAMARLCRVADIEFMSPFWSLYFFAYLGYTPALDAMSYPNLRTLSARASAQALQSGMSTGTGRYYRSLIGH